MGNAYIFNEHLSAADRAVIQAAVQVAGYTAVYTVPPDVSSVDPHADIGVVGLPAAPEDIATINAYTKSFAGAGVRVVVIWLRKEEAGGAGIPEAIGNYGVTVDISSPELTATLNGDTDVWQEPGGKPVPKAKVKRNKC